MEWTECIRGAIGYMEEHMLEQQNGEAVSRAVGVSTYYLQKGFKFMTGYTMAEYVRNRRLYLAALEVLAGKGKVIDIAYKYGYDTPESFTKAFTRFHKVSPMQLRKEPSKLQVFLPLKIKIQITGGNDMDYTVEEMKKFKLIGFQRYISYETGYKDIPDYWLEFCRKYTQPLRDNNQPQNAIEEAICENCIGEYGVCIEDEKQEGKFLYMIAGLYKGGEIPEGMYIYEFPDVEWVKFRCVGPTPGALQAVNTKIFQEWLPGNNEFEFALNANIEWYSGGDNQAPDYESAIWVPVRRK